MKKTLAGIVFVGVCLLPFVAIAVAVQYRPCVADVATISRADVANLRTMESVRGVLGQPHAIIKRYDSQDKHVRTQWTYRATVRDGNLTTDCDIWWNPDGSFSSMVFHDSVTGEWLR